MNYSQISKLSEVSPSCAEIAKESVKRLPGKEFNEKRGLTIFNKDGDFQLFVPQAKIPFLHDYSQVDFAWTAVSRLALLRRPFPIYLVGSDSWVYKAWALLRFGPDCLDKDDLKAFQQAWSLAFEGKQASTAAMLKALLLGTDSSVYRVSKDMALPYSVVEAFEVLFFNVVGRKQDATFLRNIVYPNSRMEEMLPDYKKDGSLEKMLIRVGYNSDRQTALFVGGYRPRGFMDATVDQASSNFQQGLMQTGAVMAASGMLWLDRSHTTLSAARSFLQTSKLSGETVGSGDGMLSLGDSFRSELNKIAISTSREIEVRAERVEESL